MSLIFCSFIVYGQSLKAVFDKTDKVYSGHDLIKELVQQQKDTQFTRYFKAIYPTDSVDGWEHKIAYEGVQLKDSVYQYTLSKYKRGVSQADSEAILVSTKVFFFKDKNYRNSRMISRKFLKGGYIEEKEKEGNSVRLKCLNSEGETVNDNGCLKYSRVNFPKHKFKRLYSDMYHKLFKVASLELGQDEKVNIRLMIVADPKTNKWNIYFNDLDKYNLSEQNKYQIIAALSKVVNSEPIDKTYFDEDLYGNLYEYPISIPIQLENI
ncbi:MULTISPECIES: hypothetical protein [Myroides]|nr:MULTISPECIES: hypothetical protein [Myroides]MVX35672.1 hypothetical protein [Myroides sp. LoEW2-1]UVD78781.1 hypothetical protein NWE55_11705 [Myroides albus]